MKNISGKTALVTGAASGIGLATSKALATHGVDLVMADIDGDRVAAEAETVAALGVRTLPLTLNVADELQWQDAANRVKSFGEVRILFSNAGVGGGAGAFETYDSDTWRWTYAVNVHAHLYACKAFLGAMKAAPEPSHLVITSSMVGLVPPPISMAYISSKFATLGIAMSLRNELAETQVGVSVLCPGMTATNVVANTHLLRPGRNPDEEVAQQADAMRTVLAGGMSPDRIGARVVKAIQEGEFYIFTHPEWRRLLEPQIAELLAAFGESADPDYQGDDIEALISANGAKRMNVSVTR